MELAEINMERADNERMYLDWQQTIQQYTKQISAIRKAQQAMAERYQQDLQLYNQFMERWTELVRKDAQFRKMPLNLQVHLLKIKLD